MNTELHEKEQGIVRRLVELMRHAEELGLNFTVLRALAEKAYREECVPEAPEALLRAAYTESALVEGQVILSEDWQLRIRRCLDKLPPQLNLVDRGAKEARCPVCDCDIQIVGGTIAPHGTDYQHGSECPASRGSFGRANAIAVDDAAS